jgi:hypothetical protein
LRSSVDSARLEAPCTRRRSRLARIAYPWTSRCGSARPPGAVAGLVSPTPQLRLSCGADDARSYADADADLGADADAVRSPDANADSDGERLLMRRLRTHTATTMGASTTEPEPESRINEWEMANWRRDEVRARRRCTSARAGREECRSPFVPRRLHTRAHINHSAITWSPNGHLSCLQAASLGRIRTPAIDDELPRRK